MSITFYSDLEVTYSMQTEVCTCEGKHSECPYCRGSGVEIFNIPTENYPNFANANASMVLASMGFDPEGLFDEAPADVFRRGLLRALNSRGLVGREPEVVQNRAKVVNGEIHRGLLSVFYGLSEDELRDRLEQLLDFVVREQRKGATVIRWH